MMIFNYLKDNKSTERVFIPINHPTDKYFGIDISELDFEDQGRFAAKYANLVDEQKAKVDALMEEFDCKYKFRSFFPEAMSNIVFEE